MLKRCMLLLAAIHFLFNASAADPEDSLTTAMMNYMRFADSVNKAIVYQKGEVKLKDFAVLKIPSGFKYVNAKQSQFILHDVWGNPKRDDVLGMLFPENGDPFKDSSYAFIISFDDMGYVEDKDAAKIDYQEMLKSIQEEEPENNKERAAEGYESIHLVRWAQQPFYDKNRKVLHWAKELEFGGNTEEHTLNYDVRVLGRKGVLSFNAVASMNELPLVKQNIDAVLQMATFTEGNAYADFNSNTDKIAAYTIGGLVAGKVLAKVGFFALILKFWKLIAGGIMGGFYLFKRFITGRRKQDEEQLTYAEEPATASEDVSETVEKSQIESSVNDTTEQKEGKNETV